MEGAIGGCGIWPGDAQPITVTVGMDQGRADKQGKMGKMGKVDEVREVGEIMQQQT